MFECLLAVKCPILSCDGVTLDYRYCVRDAFGRERTVFLKHDEEAFRVFGWGLKRGRNEPWAAVAIVERHVGEGKVRVISPSRGRLLKQR
jgi:hypothetical protein